VLLTGPFGNVGTAVRREIAGRGHDVRCFDVPTRKNRARAKQAGVDVVWGDIRDAAAVKAAAADRDVVVHLAAIIPPGSIRDPVLAESVNVGGTTNVIAACRAADHPVKVVYTSSLALFGPTQHLAPPRTLADPIVITDDYTRHKAKCEDLLHESGLDVAILRLGAVIPIDVLGVIDPLMFEVPLTDRIEFVHPWDVGLAIVHAIESDEVWGHTYLIGGGSRCQLYQREIIQKPMEALGIGMLPDDAFTTKPFHTDWLDTAESQRVLEFQRYTFDDCVGHMLEYVGWKRPFVRLARPIARWQLLRTSPYHRAGDGAGA
jgi:nucleoside-diphosphate-sugar epimerase